MTTSEVVGFAEPEVRADMRALLKSVGINVTEEGIARARRRRLEVAARWTPERWARLRKQVGLPEEAE